MSLTLIIASKCYSSWSLRPWLLMKALGIPFEEDVILLKQQDTASAIAEFSPTGRLPALKDGDLTVWDSLAIIEYLVDCEHDHGLWPKESDHRIWPHDRQRRAVAYTGSASRSRAASRRMSSWMDGASTRRRRSARA